MCGYNWITLLYIWNIINQLYLNLKNIKKCFLLGLFNYSFIFKFYYDEQKYFFTLSFYLLSSRWNLCFKQKSLDLKLLALYFHVQRWWVSQS